MLEAQSLENPRKEQKLDKKKKESKGKIEGLQKKITSTAEYGDPRFPSLFTSHLFALDPKNPQFKKTSSCVAECS